MTVSAQTKKSLEDNQRRLLEYLVEHPKTELANVAYSTTTRRTHYRWRSQYTAESTGRLIEQLRNETLSSSQMASSITAKPKVIFMFGGQGPPQLGIAEELYVTHPVFRGHINALQDLCKDLCPDMRRTVFSILTSDSHLSHVEDHVAEKHLAIVCFQLALAELWKSWGIKPDIVLGHSIGEYAALATAGVLSVADTLWLVSKRARLFESTLESSKEDMLSISATSDDIFVLLELRERYPNCDIACFNSPESHVVGGPIVDLRKLKKDAKSKGIPAQFLEVPYAFHSRSIELVTEQIEEMARKVTIFPPQIPVSSTVTGEIITEDNVFNAQYFARHARQPVQFANAVRSAEAFLKGDQDSPLWVEIGSTSTCLTLVRQTLDVAPSRLLASMHRYKRTWTQLTTSLGKGYVAGLDIDWAEFHRLFAKSLKLLDLPTYAFDLKTYWRPYTTATASGSGICMGNGGRNQYKFVPTATVQKIQHRKVSDGRIEATFVSSLSDSRLRHAIEGHSIEGISICPVSVYADMAFAAAAYVRGTAGLDTDKKSSLGSLKHLKLKNPFVLREDWEYQTIVVKVFAEKIHDWKAHISFQSQYKDHPVDYHGTCQVVRSNGFETGEHNIEHIRIRSSTIMEYKDSSEAIVDHLHRRMFYKLYGTVVKYDKRYQGITEAFIPEVFHLSVIREAVAEVELTDTPLEERDAFTLNPYHTDALVHVGGFAINIKIPGQDDFSNSDTSDSDASVDDDSDDADLICFASGIDSITIRDDLGDGVSYRSYFCTLSTPEGEPTSNVYIFSGDELVGLVTGLRFYTMRKDSLSALLRLQQGDRQPPRVTHTPKQSTQPRQRESGTTTTTTTVVPVPQPTSKHSNMAEVFISALLAETGISKDDIGDDTSLLELGVDSLMGIAILRKVRAETGQNLPVSIFSELLTIGDVQARLGSVNSSPAPAQAATPNPTATVDPLFKSSADLIHGPHPSATRPLFLIAGSMGSASIFASLPPLPSSTPIWALEFPLLHHPSQLDDSHTPEALAPAYIAALKSVQPTGPYLLGGYSAGAVHAYEVARALLEAGEVVERLVLLDMKAHRPGETWASAPRIEDVELLGTLLHGNGNGNGSVLRSEDAITAAQLENERLFASLRCMYNWRPIPMRTDRRPLYGTVMIWARSGLAQRGFGPGTESSTTTASEEEQDRENPMGAENRDFKTWFYAPRHTYDANGWDVLVGDVQTHVVDGDHWSMLQMPHVGFLRVHPPLCLFPRPPLFLFLTNDRYLIYLGYGSLQAHRRGHHEELIENNWGEMNECIHPRLYINLLWKKTTKTRKKKDIGMIRYTGLILDTVLGELVRLAERERKIRRVMSRSRPSNKIVIEPSIKQNRLP